MYLTNTLLLKQIVSVCDEYSFVYASICFDLVKYYMFLAIWERILEATSTKQLLTSSPSYIKHINIK